MVRVSERARAAAVGLELLVAALSSRQLHILATTWRSAMAMQLPGTRAGLSWHIWCSGKYAGAYGKPGLDGCLSTDDCCDCFR